MLIRGVNDLFILSYIVLMGLLLWICKSYLADNEEPDRITVVFLGLAAIGCALTMPDPNILGDAMTGFATYAFVAGAPVLTAAPIVVKMISEFIINSDDWRPGAKKDFTTEVREPLDEFIVNGHYEEGLKFLRKSAEKHPKDYRFNMEIANLAVSYMKDYELAVTEFQAAISKTKKPEACAYAMYRIADIHYNTPGKRTEAKECLQEVMRLYPKTEYAKTADLRYKLIQKEDAGLIPKPNEARPQISVEEIVGQISQPLFQDAQETVPQAASADSEAISLKKESIPSVSEEYAELLKRGTKKKSVKEIADKEPPKKRGRTPRLIDNR